eukprot:jgi/Picsp_1/5071/NSC_02434-R1_predicted protein [Phaeodactylum tricornutum CCAP 1055/1]
MRSFKNQEVLNCGRFATLAAVTCIVNVAVLIRGQRMCAPGEKRLDITAQQQAFLYPPLTDSDRLVDVYTFQKDEGKLLQEWGLYHGAIFGYKALHIIDHASTDNETKEALGFFRRKGATVVYFNGSFLDKHEQLSNLMLQSSARFLLPIDVDEFLAMRDTMDNRTFVTDADAVLHGFGSLPIDGRRYRMNSIHAKLCSSLLDIDQDSMRRFSRTKEMKVFEAPKPINCMSKSFFLRATFVKTDQGNHGGVTTMDALDRKQKNTVKGCPYYHNTDMRILHYGATLPWQLWYIKMMRGVQVYGHKNAVDAGRPCKWGLGVHYCQFYERLVQIGEESFRREYERNRVNCNDRAKGVLYESDALANEIHMILSTPGL